MQTEKRVNVPDLRDVLEFWSLKDDIMGELLTLLKYRRDKNDIDGDFAYAMGAALINKIESIGKKENER